LWYVDKECDVIYKYVVFGNVPDGSDVSWVSSGASVVS
jgi:hypothetical protein